MGRFPSLRFGTSYQSCLHVVHKVRAHPSVTLHPCKVGSRLLMALALYSGVWILSKSLIGSFEGFAFRNYRSIFSFWKVFTYE